MKKAALKEEDGLVFRKKSSAPCNAPAPAMTLFSVVVDLLLLIAVTFIVIAGILKISSNGLRFNGEKITGKMQGD